VSLKEKSVVRGEKDKGSGMRKSDMVGLFYIRDEGTH